MREVYAPRRPNGQLLPGNKLNPAGRGCKWPWRDMPIGGGFSIPRKFLGYYARREGVCGLYALARCQGIRVSMRMRAPGLTITRVL